MQTHKAARGTAVEAPGVTPYTAGSTSTVRRQTTVKYFKRMFRNRVYPLTVSLTAEGARSRGAAANGDSSGTTVVVQPIVPGALVTPTMAEIPVVAGGDARFHVMPLTSPGLIFNRRLPEARVEFRSGGQTLSTVPMKMKVSRRRLAWIFLFLTISLPLLLFYIKTTRWEFRAELTEMPAGLANRPGPFGAGERGVRGNANEAPVPPGPSKDAPPDDKKPGQEEKKPEDNDASKSKDKDKEPQTDEKKNPNDEKKPGADDKKPLENELGYEQEFFGVAQEQENPQKGADEKTPSKEGNSKETAPGPAGGGRGRPGMGAGGAPGRGAGGPMPVPPLPKDRPVMILRTGSDGLERWITAEADRRKGLDLADHDTRDLFFVGLAQIKPVVVNSYWGFDFARTMQWSELYLLGILLTLTLILFAIQGPIRPRKRGPILEVAAG